MTIYKPIKAVASKAAEIAVKLASGKPIIVKHGVNNNKIEVPSVLIDVVSVTNGNMMETVIADEFHSYEDVYRGVPENQRPPKN